MPALVYRTSILLDPMFLCATDQKSIIMIRNMDKHAESSILRCLENGDEYQVGLGFYSRALR